MRGGVPRYVAQATPQFDADSAVVAKKATMAKSAIAEKCHLWMETSYTCNLFVGLARFFQLKVDGFIISQWHSQKTFYEAVKVKGSVQDLFQAFSFELSAHYSAPPGRIYPQYKIWYNDCTIIFRSLCNFVYREENMQEFPSRERREYLRAALWVDVDFSVVNEEEHEAVMRSEQQPGCRFISQAALPSDEGGQYEADSTFRSNLIDFLIRVDDKLDRVLKLLSRASGPEGAACKDDKGDDQLFVGRGSDISGNGMSIICDKTFEQGQILKTSFTISRFPVIRLVLFGRVVRVATVQEDGKQCYQVVVKFIDLDEDDREKIIAYTFQAQREAIRKKRRG